MGLVVAIAVVILLITIYVKFSDKTDDDIDSFNQCISRGAQAGGRGECSIDAACSDVVPKAGEYAAYLGLRCSGEQPGVSEGRTYCCIVIPRDRNPPAGTLAEGHINNNRKWCESTEATVGKAVGVLTSDSNPSVNGELCYPDGNALLRSETGFMKIRYFKQETGGAVFLNSHVEITKTGNAFFSQQDRVFSTGMLSDAAQQPVAEFIYDVRDAIHSRPGMSQSDLSGVAGHVSFTYSESTGAKGTIKIPFTIP